MLYNINIHIIYRKKKNMRLFNYIKNSLRITKSQFIEEYNKNHIMVNDKIVNMSYIIKDGDVVTYNGQIVEKEDFVYYLYNKPRGLVCTNDLENKDSYLKTINLEKRVFCVGRLDKESSGLLILTNDGKYTNELLNPITHVEKEYIVRVKEKIGQEFIEKVQKPIILKGKLTKENRSYLIDDYTFGIILTEGKYHQIRKTVKNAGNYVTDLKRIRIGKYKIDCIKEGEIIKIDI